MARINFSFGTGYRRFRSWVRRSRSRRRSRRFKYFI